MNSYNNYQANNQSLPSKLNEGLEHGDLRRLVYPMISIDEYKSKMGEDADIMVLAFKVLGKDPSNDLMEFIERGYDFVLDADISSGEDSDGNWLVFVEMERSRLRAKDIVRLIEEILNLTEQSIEDWNFTYKDSRVPFAIDVENIEEQVPLSPKQYRERFGDKDMDKLKENARIPINRKVPSNYYTDQIKIAAGLK